MSCLGSGEDPLMCDVGRRYVLGAAGGVLMNERSERKLEGLLA